ncbi:MAG: glycosyltransferase family 39 protein [Fibromonadales bacterium]|nr:glycosyltransferase family 39 protein [Fibromonadales bacterium]
MEIIKKLREPLLYLLPLLAFTGFWIIPKTSISNVALTTNGVSYAESLPISKNIQENSDFSVSFNINVKNKKKAIYKVIPDDCILSIEINEKKFPQELIKNSCDYNNGTVLDFSEYIQEGLNKFEFQIKNHGGPGGLRIDYARTGFSSVEFKHILFSALLLITTALILKKLNFSKTAVFLIILGIAIRLVYSSYTDIFDRVYDVLGHLEYIDIIADESRIPSVGETWSSNHPPLYYLFGASIKNFFPEHYQYILVKFALLISFISIIFGIAFLQNLNFRRRFLFLSGLLFVSWPGFVICSTRIGNDVPAYLGMFICIYYTQKWWNEREAKYMILASIGAALGIMFKSTALAVAGAWILIWLIGTLHSFKLASIKTIAICIAIALASIFAAQGRTIITAIKGEKVYIANTTTVNSRLKVNNSLGNYAYFDVKEYLTVPYLDTYNDKGGRQYFLNFAIKSSLFGEYKVWNTNFGQNLALMLAAITIPLLALFIAGLFASDRKFFPAMLFLLALLASLVANRVMYPLSCMQDTRYIMPIVLPLCAFIMHGANKISHFSIRITAYCIIGLFSFLSLMFIIGSAFN